MLTPLTRKSIEEEIVNTKKYVTIAEEVDQLLIVGFIKETHYPEWLSNIILVKSSMANGECV